MAYYSFRNTDSLVIFSSLGSSINHVDRAGGGEVSEKTMFVHMGGVKVPHGQKCFTATNFVHMNSNALLVLLFLQLPQ